MGSINHKEMFHTVLAMVTSIIQSESLKTDLGQLDLLT